MIFIIWTCWYRDTLLCPKKWIVKKRISIAYGWTNWKRWALYICLGARTDRQGMSNAADFEKASWECAIWCAENQSWTFERCQKNILRVIKALFYHQYFMILVCWNSPSTIRIDSQVTYLITLPRKKGFQLYWWSGILFHWIGRCRCIPRLLLCNESKRYPGIRRRCYPW